MTKAKFKATGMMVLIAGAVLCLPQVAGASSGARGSPAAMGSRSTTSDQDTTTAAKATTTTVEHQSTTSTTAVKVVLIPPLIIRPTTDPPAKVAAQADPPAAGAAPAADPASGATLPFTGSSHVGVMAVFGLALIALGLALRRSAAY